MIRSMTGYGRGSIQESGRGFTVELKSVNNRYLDIYIRLPKQINALEDNIRKYIATRVYRGKIDVYISQDKFSQDDIEVNIDDNIANAYYNALLYLKDKFGLNDDITLSQISGMPDVIKIEKRDEDKDEIWKMIETSLNQALDMLIDMRSKEGLKLSMDISDRCRYISERVLDIEKRSPQIIEEFREKIQQRVLEYLKDVEIDESRLLNEVAFFADKSSITEEIVRLKSHLNQMNEILKEDEPVGRKLDFLIQEMNREVNTIGSKANDLTITGIVVDLKSELEKIREQIQNIE